MRFVFSSSPYCVSQITYQSVHVLFLTLAVLAGSLLLSKHFQMMDSTVSDNTIPEFTS